MSIHEANSLSSLHLGCTRVTICEFKFVRENAEAGVLPCARGKGLEERQICLRSTLAVLFWLFPLILISRLPLCGVLAHHGLSHSLLLACLENKDCWNPQYSTVHSGKDNKERMFCFNSGTIYVPVTLQTNTEVTLTLLVIKSVTAKYDLVRVR